MPKHMPPPKRTPEPASPEIICAQFMQEAEKRLNGFLGDKDKQAGIGGVRPEQLAPLAEAALAYIEKFAAFRDAAEAQYPSRKQIVAAKNPPAMTGLHRAATALAAELCDAWPSLQDRMGARHDMATEAHNLESIPMELQNAILQSLYDTLKKHYPALPTRSGGVGR